MCCRDRARRTASERPGRWRRSPEPGLGLAKRRPRRAPRLADPVALGRGLGRETAARTRGTGVVTPVAEEPVARSNSIVLHAERVLQSRGPPNESVAARPGHRREELGRVACALRLDAELMQVLVGWQIVETANRIADRSPPWADDVTRLKVTGGRRCLLDQEVEFIDEVAEARRRHGRAELFLGRSALRTQERDRGRAAAAQLLRETTGRGRDARRKHVDVADHAEALAGPPELASQRRQRLDVPIEHPNVRPQAAHRRTATVNGDGILRTGTLQRAQRLDGGDERAIDG